MVALGTSVPEGLLGSRVRDLAREGGLAFTNPSGWEDAYRSRQWFAPLWRGVNHNVAWNAELVAPRPLDCCCRALTPQVT